MREVVVPTSTTKMEISWCTQLFSKWMDFSSISENTLKYYVNLLNLQPRKRINYKTPYEVFFHKNLKLHNSC